MSAGADSDLLRIAVAAEGHLPSCIRVTQPINQRQRNLCLQGVWIHFALAESIEGCARASALQQRTSPGRSGRVGGCNTECQLGGRDVRSDAGQLRA